MRHLDTNSLIGKEYVLNDLVYKIEKEVGAGGVGVVYKATNSEKKLSVCLKILNPLKRFDLNRNLIERFYREARIAKELRHENMLEIYDVGKFLDYHHYSMEFCPGGNLQAFLRKGSFLSFDCKWNIFKQICSALNSIHEKGYVHRDLKPDNVLIKTENFIPNGIITKLSDFGTLLNIANIADNPSFYSNDIIGSLIYISPEQRQGKVLNQQSDIFSLGILFYQLLIEDTYEYRLRFDESFKGLDYDEKFAFQTIINRMCEGDLRFRYKSLGDVLIDIKRKLLPLDSYLLKKLEFPIWAKPIEKILDIDFPSSNIYHSIKYSVHRYDEELWRFPTWNSDEDDIANTLYDYPTEAIVSNGTVFAGWNTGYFTSISLYSGKLNWSVKLSDEAIYSTPLCKSGKIYIVGKSGKLFCIDTYDEKIKWILDLNDNCSCPLNIIGNILYIVSNSGKIFLVDKEIGTLTTTLQFTKTYGSYRTPQIHNAISFDNSIVFSHDDCIYGYPDITQIKEGKSFNWSCNTPVEVRSMSVNCISGMAYDGKRIFATTLFGSVLCLNSVTGDGVWKIDIGEDIYSPPSIFEDFVTFITAKGYLYVCDKNNGASLKRIFVGESRFNSSKGDDDYVTAIMSEETILIIYEYCLKLLDRTSYKEVASWEIGKEPRPCPTFSRNIVITSSTNGLVAFQQKMSNEGIGGC